MKHIVTLLAASALATGLHAEAIQQLAPTTIVTGGLWDSELQSTTASVSVLSAETLEASGSQHFGDIINAIPNLTWTGGSSRPRYIQIRGIGENSQFEGETPDSSVRFLVDDLDFTGIGTIGNLFDVQQVEVLRGPQAGAFGVNAAGGVIKLVSNEPTPYWTGQVEGTVGNDSLLSGGIAVGGPILENDPEKLTFRFAAYQLEQDGFRDNKFLNRNDTNERNEFNTRLKVRWIANDDWQWDGTVFYANADNGYDEWSLDNTEFDTFSDELGRDEQESIAGSLRGTWTGLDNVIVTTISSYSDTNSTNSFDGDWANPIDKPDTYIGFAFTDRERARWSEEIRFDSADEEDAFGFIDRWTAGLYYENFEEDTAFGGDFGEFESTFETETYSIYGQATHLFSDRTRMTLGLRAEHYELNAQPDFRDDVDFDDWMFGGKLTLEHDLCDNTTAFASITRGYKAGGANIYPYLDAALPTEYGTEDLWNYEIGLRADWFDGAVSSQFTVFYLDRDEAQLRDSAGTGLDFTYFTTNGEGAQHYGAEAEATWFINQNWSITAAFGVLETDRDSYRDPGDPLASIASRELANAPAFSYSARIDYTADNGFFANFEVSGSDEYYESNSHNEERSAFVLYNAAIGYHYENWTLTLWGRNIFDKSYEKRVFNFGNEGPDYLETRYENPADPQQFGVTLNYAW
ncbi:MAG: TonB-dependent receptor [Opitutaceae bacterium]